ncbi:MAG TPA: sigma-70 family RNA polymerase sigma factor [Actinomycetota bacterium]|nr:sigma-70 family RNA polymerase sigma factor [Actinomycetota bacterium]
MGADEGRRQRFRVVYEDHAARVARYAARRTDPDDVLDVVSETFLVAWRRFDDVPPDPLPWLLATARRVIANRRRSSTRRRALGQKLAIDAASAAETGSFADLPEVDRRLLEAIRALPPRQREAFMLVAWDDLDPTRAARSAGCNVATFRMRLHRARRRLRNQMTLDPRPATADVPSTTKEPR